MIKKFIEFINRKTVFSEVLRFAIVGGLATIIDFLVMGVVLYVFDPTLYPKFYNVFFGGGEPKLIATLVGTGTGFLFGLMANYLLSIAFVFNEKGKSKSTVGFIKFAIFSVIGLLIHEIGMLALFNIFGMNEWLVKILLTVVVLIYNYLTRRLFIFKDVNDIIEEKNLEGETNEKD